MENHAKCTELMQDETRHIYPEWRRVEPEAVTWADRARQAGTSVDGFKYVGQICNFLLSPECVG